MSEQDISQLADLLDQIEAGHDSAQVCAFTRLVNGLDDPTKERLTRIVESSNLPVSKILVALHRSGYRIAKETLRFHRKKECVCFRSAKVEA